MQNGQGNDQRRNVVVKEFLEEHVGKLERAVARTADGKPLVDARRAITLFGLEAAENPDLLACHPISVLQCLLATVSMGLEPGRDVHFIPRKDKETGQRYCTYIVDYKGLLSIALRTGNIKKIEARVVFRDEVEQGRFSYHAGDDERIVHHPMLDSANREPKDVYAAYAIAYLANGERVRDVLTRADLIAIGQNSHGDLWNDPYNGIEMARKSAVRRLFKYLPFPPEVKAAVEAADQSGRDFIEVPAEPFEAPASPALPPPEARVTFSQPEQPPKPETTVAAAASAAKQKMTASPRAAEPARPAQGRQYATAPVPESTPLLPITPADIPF